MRDKWKVFFLCLFFGWLGVHRYYERKYVTGVLYTLTLGVLGIGWVFDICSIFTRPLSVEKTGQYIIYLNAVNKLRQNGYEFTDDERQWNEISDFVKKNSTTVGRIFVVTDPKPTFLPALIGAFSSEYRKNHYEHTSYASKGRVLEIAKTRCEREGRNFDCYWPNDSLVGGWCEGEDDEWLNIFKAAIEAEDE